MNKTKIVSLLILMGIFALAFSLRTLPFYSRVFIEEKIILHDTDSYYHMRRITNMLQNRFKLIQFDYYLNYPEGAVSFWPGGFDRMTAMFVWALSLGKPVKELAEKISCYFPPLIGAASIILVWVIGRMIFNNTCGLLAALFMALQPGYLFYSRLGKIDHHVAETFFTLLMYYFFIKLLKSLHQTIRPYSWAILTGIGIWFSYIVWSGATVYLGPILLTMYLSLYALSRDEIPKYLRSYFLVLISALIFLLYPCLSSWWGRQGIINFEALSLFHIYLLLFLSLFFIIAHLGFKMGLLFRLRTTRLMFVVTTLYCLGIALYAIFFPGAKNQFIEGFKYLTKIGLTHQSAWLRTIAENQPLLYVDKQFSLYQGVKMLGWGFYIMPLGLLVFIIRTIKKKVDYPMGIFIIFWTITLGIIALRELRYCYNFAACVSLFSAYTFYLAYEALKKKKLDFKLYLKPKQITLIIVLFFLGMNSKILLGEFRETRPLLSPSQYELLTWLKDNTPKTSFYDNPARKPEYGIMCFWDWGHYVEYISERPAAVNPYGHGVEKMLRFYLSHSEEEANNLMEENNLRYCITSEPLGVIEGLRKISLLYPKESYSLVPEGPFLNISKREFFSPINTKLHLFDGSQIYVFDVKVDGLKHYRLLFETKDYSDFLCFGIPVRTAREKIFEYVKGARYSGKTTPDTEIKVSLPVITNINRKFLYTYKVKSDSKGKFELILPYATYGSRHPVKAQEDYTITVGKKRWHLRVSEEEVIKGEVI